MPPDASGAAVRRDVRRVAQRVALMAYAAVPRVLRRQPAATVILKTHRRRPASGAAVALRGRERRTLSGQPVVANTNVRWPCSSPSVTGGGASRCCVSRRAPACASCHRVEDDAALVRRSVRKGAPHASVK